MCGGGGMPSVAAPTPSVSSVQAASAKQADKQLNELANNNSKAWAAKDSTDIETGVAGLGDSAQEKNAKLTLGG